MARKVLLCLLVVSLCLAGCALKRGVEDDNVFVSSASPPTKIKVSQEMKYIGKGVAKQVPVSYTQGDGGSFVDYEWHIFSKISENNVLNKGVLIKFSRIQVGYVMPEIFKNLKNKLTSGEIKINGKVYQFMSIAGKKTKIFNKYEGTWLETEGYIIPNCLMTKGLARILSADRGATFKIIYFEDIKNFGASSCEDWSDANSLTDEQKQLLKKFEQNHARDIQILK